MKRFHVHVAVPDLHATIHCALGVNPEKYLYDEDRPVPITDLGQPLRQLFASGSDG